MKDSAKRPGLIRIVATLPIKAYQVLISPLLPPSCIYHPTCSNYAVDAIHKHGAGKGLILAVLRIVRCNGFFQGGNDEVDENLTIGGALGKYKEYSRRNH